MPALRAFPLFALGLLLLALLLPLDVSAEDQAYRVVVHASNPTRAIERTFLADAFLKKATRWDYGETIKPLDQRADSSTRRAFSLSILKRSIAAVRSYWQQRIFSGRDVPPPELDSDESVIAYVERNPGAVGYVSSAAKLGSARELQVR
jgi:ABC-type phosphate transport system substrate-binding protein